MLAFIGHIAQLIINPRRGWEDIAADSPLPRRMLLSGLIPFILITALTSFVRVCYFTDYTMVDALQNAIITAVTYFATYFIASFIISMQIPLMETPEKSNEGAEQTDRVEIFSASIVGILLLITLISNLIPLDLSLLQYLPIYSVYVIWKGAEYLQIDRSKTGRFMIVAVLSILVPVYILGYFFHLFT
ncbi:MAG: hypothetical protein K2M07_06360 [Muribaculaceae bacterium]|nr:hypothetical protein [Muribaculaceae bacterium]